MASEVGPVGIGVVLNAEHGHLKITSINPNGSAAASCKVQVGDLLVAINDVRLTSVFHAKQLILGPSTSSLKVELSRSGQTLTVNLWRGGPDAQMKGEAAEKAKADAETKLIKEVDLKVDAASSVRSVAACGGGLSFAAFKGQPLALH
jgi:C-terminal processing protease CtpA/Prc